MQDDEPHALAITSTTAIADDQTVERLGGGFVLTRRLGGFRLVRRWASLPVVLFLMLWCAIWDSVVIGGILSGTMPLLFIFTHGGAGLAVTYVMLANLLNKTTVEVEAGVLSVRHGPLPWPRPADLRARDVQRLQVRSTTGSKGQVSWELHAALEGGKDVALVKGLQVEEQARTMERLIQGHLSSQS